MGSSDDTTSPGDLRRFLRARIARLLDPAGRDHGLAEETARWLADRVVDALLTARAETGSEETAR
jgi:hypothetical protein